MSERADASQCLVVKAGQVVKLCHGLKLWAAARVGE